MADVSGKIMTETSEPVEQVTLDTRGGQTVPSFKTSSSGTYAFDNLPMYGAYSIIPVRTDHPTNGVSTIDLILIQKHIIGEQVITSPYHLIAADADKSGWILKRWGFKICSNPDDKTSKMNALNIFII